MVTIEVNGQSRDIETGTTVATLVASCGLNPRQVAVEVNLELVPRRQYENTLLNAGDRIEIVTLVGGG